MTTAVSRTFTISTALLLIASLIWGFREYSKKNELHQNLDKEKLRYESLLSEKLSVEKDRDKSIRLADDFKRKNLSLSKAIEITNSKLRENSNALQRAINENSISRIKYNELLTARQNLEEQLSSLKDQQQNLVTKNQEINNDLSSLRAENEKLKEDLRMARLTHFDKPLIETTRGRNNKLVVKASRVQKLRAVATIGADVDELKFTVINPRGIVLTDRDGVVTSQVLGTTPSGKQVEMTFSPKKKLQPGLYQIEVVSGAMHIASLQVSLR